MTDWKNLLPRAPEPAPPEPSTASESPRVEPATPEPRMGDGDDAYREMEIAERRLEADERRQTSR